MPVGLVLNHIKTHATGTHERKEQSQQNLEVFNVDLFSKNTIEEDIMNIKLINLLITLDRKEKTNLTVACLTTGLKVSE